jgi:hypothetical protein
MAAYIYGQKKGPYSIRIHDIRLLPKSASYPIPLQTMPASTHVDTFSSDVRHIRGKRVRRHGYAQFLSIEVQKGELSMSVHHRCFQGIVLVLPRTYRPLCLPDKQYKRTVRIVIYVTSQIGIHPNSELG